MKVPGRTARRRREGVFTLATVLAGLCFAGDLFFWHLSVMHTTVANATFFATTAPMPRLSNTARMGPPAMMPVPASAARSTTLPAP